MIILNLAISTFLAVFGGAATYVASGSLLLAFTAYAGTGFLAMVAFLIVALLLENWRPGVQSETALYPAE